MTALEAAYNEQALELQEARRELGNLRTFASIASRKGQATKRASMTKGRSKHFVKLIKTPMQYALKKKLLSPAEKELLLTILPFVEWETQLVLNPKGTAASINDIASLMGCHRNKAGRIVASLEEKGFVIVSQSGSSKYLRICSEYARCGEDMHYTECS